MGLKAEVPLETWLGLVAEGRKRFAPDAALYVRPMVWAEQGGALLVAPDPDSTRWCLSLYEAPMREPGQGFSVTLSPYRKPSQECAPADAKAGCLYPNNGRMLMEARARGYRQLPGARSHRQHRGAGHRQHLHGEGRRGVHADRQRPVPQRHHPPAHHRAAARGLA